MSPEPSFRPTRFGRIIKDATTWTDLDLTHLSVLTEAATGAFAATAPLAAWAGAKVYAVAKPNRHGSAQQAIRETLALAKTLKVEDRISFIRSSNEAPLEEIDLLTNSGNVRPITPALLRSLPKTSVLSLMVEPWEVRNHEVPLKKVEELEIAVAGPNEGGSQLNLFSSLGTLLIHVLNQQHVSPRGKHFYLDAADRFRPHLLKEIRKRGGTLVQQPGKAEIAVLATGPDRLPLQNLLKSFRSKTWVVQIWADIPSHLRSSRLRWLPKKPPPVGHMGFLLSDLGPEPAIRLAAGGLKVGELLSRGRHRGLEPASAVRRAVRLGFALAPTE